MIVVVDHLSSKLSDVIGQFYTVDRKGLEMLDYCQSLGEAYAGFINGDLICCWGLIPPSFLSTQAYLWMWGPPKLKHQLVFIRHSQIQVQKMLERYETIVGECLIGAASARRWLQWLGADFGTPQNGLIPFTIRKQHG